jgi:hypothetical protein
MQQVQRSQLISCTAQLIPTIDMLALRATSLDPGSLSNSAEEIAAQQAFVCCKWAA